MARISISSFFLFDMLGGPLGFQSTKRATNVGKSWAKRLLAKRSSQCCWRGTGKFPKTACVSECAQDRPGTAIGVAQADRQWSSPME
jgi:hypothetical protein